MLRSWSVVGLLFVCALQVGCSSCGMRFGCEGCGEKYWGAYINDPPRCEPCDCYGNYTGCGDCKTGCTEASCGEVACGQATCGEPSCGADSCCGTSDGCGSKYPWMRSLNRRASFWQMLSDCNKRSNSKCCPTGCGDCTTGCTTGCAAPTCGEPACGEPACGEPGCGVSHGFMSSRSPMRSSTSMQMVSHGSNIDYRMQPSTGGCNCGKH